MKHRARKPPRTAVVILRSLRRASGWQVASVVGTCVAESALPVVFLFETAKLVGLLAGPTSEATWRDVTVPLALACVAYVGQQLANSFRTSVCAAAGARIELALREELLSAVSAPTGIGHLEDRRYADELGWAKGFMEGYAPPRQMLASALNLVAARARALGGLYVLLTFRWWAALAALVAYRLHDRWMTRDVRLLVDSARQGTSHARAAAYARELAISAPPAKEVRTLALGGWLTTRYTRAGSAALDQAWRSRRGNRVTRYAGASALLLCLTGIVVALALATSAGDIDVTKLTQCLQAVLLVSGLGFVGDDQWRLAQAVSCLPHVDEIARRSISVVEREPAPRQGVIAAAPLKSLVVRELRFRYPGRDHEVLQGLDLTIPIGRVTAIVGSNGAGKTSLIKLLARLYEPTSGMIVANGTPIGAIPADAWRARLAVIFQDFVRYETTVRDNIVVSDAAVPDRILERIIELADLTEVVERLPNGLDTVLSRAYRGGVDLSGGQWQKLALARAMASVEAGADIVVLDEPTASLDVRAEAAFLERFQDYVRGRTALLVSHRLATVRGADLIVVLENGRVVEAGRHEDLVVAGTRYGRMFDAQASRYLQRDHHVAATS